MKNQLLHIIAFSDAHGKYLSDDGYDISNPAGLDRLSSYLKTIRGNGERVLLIDNGDTIQGHPLVDWHDYQGQYSDKKHPTNIAGNLLGVDVFVPGNHEFNFGMERLQQIKSDSQAQWVSCNILHKETGEYLFEPYVIHEWSGFKIGVIGAVTDFVPKWENPAHIRDLEFQPVLDAIKKPIEQLKDKVDVLVVSYHGGLEQNPCKEHTESSKSKENIGCELIRRFPEIDILITGHQHDLRMESAGRDFKTLVIQPGSHGKHWADVSLKNVDSKLKIERQQSRLVSSVDSPVDASYAQELQDSLQRMQKNMNLQVGSVVPDFLIQDPMQDVWLNKHPLIQWQNDILRRVTGADIAASPLLDATHPGIGNQVSMKDLFKVYPYPNSPTVLKINGQILRQAMELSASFFDWNETSGIDVAQGWRKGEKIRSYDYDIFDGIEYEIDPSQPEGSRVSNIRFQGNELHPDQELTLAVSSYRSAGAFYRMYSRDMVVDEYPDTMMYLMLEDLKGEESFSVQVQQNFKVIVH